MLSLHNMVQGVTGFVERVLFSTGISYIKIQWTSIKVKL